MPLRALTTFILFIVVCASAHATSIILESESLGSVPGTYDYYYGFVVSEGGPTLTFYPSSYFTLSGLNGVTDAFVYDEAEFYAEYSPTTAVVVNGEDEFIFPSSNTSDSTYYNILKITSTSSAVGEVNFSINTPNTYIGQVLGPVAAATPEPASFCLLATGFACLAGLFRKRSSTGATA